MMASTPNHQVFSRSNPSIRMGLVLLYDLAPGGYGWRRAAFPSITSGLITRRIPHNAAESAGSFATGDSSI